MKIGVISDTHLRDYSPRLREVADVYFGDADMIIHAGDIVNIKVLDAFFPKHVEAVSGNMDSWEVNNQLPDKRVLTVGDFRIGLIHGWGNPVGLEEQIRQQFKDIHCIVFGHTHYPVNRWIDGILFFNPGSPTDKRFVKQNTIGILEIGKKITGTIITIEGI